MNLAAAGVTLEPAAPGDVPSLLEMLSEMAEFLRVPQSFTNNPESLTLALFGEVPTCEAIVARDAGRAAGFAIWSELYRPFSGRKALWFDYIYVRPEFRRKPLAMTMLAQILALAKDRDYVAIYGMVLDWNEGAKNLYSLLGIEELDVKLFTLRLADIDWSLLGPVFAKAASDRPT